MKGKDLKPWKCLECKAVMGLTFRNGRGIRQMMLYREALRPGAFGENGHAPKGDNLPDVMAIIEGYAADIRCSCCGKPRTWVPGEEAIRKIIKNYEARK